MWLQHAPSLLLWFWILAAGSVIVTLLPVPLPESFKDAVRLSAARGKLWSQRPQSLGVLNDLSVPQSWFLHFYAIGTACCLVLLALATAARSATGSSHPTPVQGECAYLALGLLTLHLIRRLLETGCMMVYPPTARMHMIAYVFGCAYYAVAPLSLMPHSFWQAADTPDRLVFWLQPMADPGRLALLKAGLLGAPVQLWAAARALVEAHAWMHVTGAVVLVLGFCIQFHSHWVLARIAASSSTATKGPPRSSAGPKEGYVLPRGGLFELVSCPHYLGEIVIYLGLALLCWPAVKPLLMLLWVVVNLILAAGATQKWYKSHFPKYPKQRKALIPFVF